MGRERDKLPDYKLIYRIHSRPLSLLQIHNITTNTQSELYMYVYEAETLKYQVTKILNSLQN